MQFKQVLLRGRLLRRYQRFLADVELDHGVTVTAHTPNTGSMRGCCEPGSRVWLSDSGNEQRKYPLSWELVEVETGVLCGINTLLANRLVQEAIESRVITELQGYGNIRAEAKYGRENSRIDLLLSQHPSQRDCYVEVKNVTLVEAGIAYFPDAVSARGTKHLRELAAMVAEGQRAVLVFCVQRGDVEAVRPADAIDPAYGQGLRQALTAGVEVLAYRATVSLEGIVLTKAIPVVCP